MSEPIRPAFWERPLEELNAPEWEALCDGCGKCCLHKVEDEDSGRIYVTNIVCRLLDKDKGCCTNYPQRQKYVPDCVQLAKGSVGEIPWLPLTCAYRLRYEGKPLPGWHYLLSGDREAVHRAGQSVRGWTVDEAEGQDLEDHLVDRPV